MRYQLHRARVKNKRCKEENSVKKAVEGGEGFPENDKSHRFRDTV